MNRFSNLALVGLYYIKDKELLKSSLTEIIEKDIKTRGEYQLTDALQLMIDKGAKVSTFPGLRDGMIAVNRKHY